MRGSLTSEHRLAFDGLDGIAAQIGIHIIDAKGHLQAGNRAQARIILRRARAQLPLLDEELSSLSQELR